MTDNNRVPIVVGLGELLWDCFCDSRRPGGAPANVAFQSGQLGCRGVVCSRVGQDVLGDELLKFLAGQGLDTQYVQRDSQHPTGTVTVDTSCADRPRYTIHRPVAWDYIECDAATAELMSQAAAVCFGSLAQRNEASRNSIQTALARTSADCLTVCDINIRQDWYARETIEQSLHLSRMLKLNEDEVPLLVELLKLDCRPGVDFCRAVQQQFAIDAVCITRAERGCLLVDGREIVDMPGVPVQVADAVGAGDAFTAAWIKARLDGRNSREQAELANRVGALVASRRGAMPDLKKEFAALI